MSKRIQIVSFDIPYPPNYGGIVDVFYKIKSLHAIGYKITLHCFQYKHNTPHAALEDLCEEVFYYKRRKNPLDLLSSTPYIVLSRKNAELLQNLKSNTDPILMEGLHCCYYAQHPDLQNHKKLIRMHNIEWHYYAALAQQDQSPIKRLFFSRESKKLKKYEPKAIRDITVLPINIAEDEYLIKQNHNSELLAAFHPYDEPSYQSQKKDIVLFHGSLDVHENHYSALWICKNIASHLPETEFVVAGKKPTPLLIQTIDKHQNVSLVADPDNAELQGLIGSAQINLIITFQNTGIKLKLLNALFAGGHCLANSQALYASELEDIVHTADTASRIRDMIKKLNSEPFTLEDFRHRTDVLMSKYNNKQTALQLSRIIESE